MPVTAPHTEKNVVGIRRSLSAPATQNTAPPPQDVTSTKVYAASTPALSVYPAESIYSTGSWTADSSCANGNKKSERLQCGGYFRYRPIVNTPSPQSPVLTGSRLTVFAADAPAGGAYPTVNVVVNDVAVYMMTNIRGNPVTNQFEQFTFNSERLIQPSTIRLEFVNDLYSNGENRNIRIDKIVLNGVDF